MKKSLLLALLASTTLASSIPAFAQTQPASGDSKIKEAGKKVGHAVMWGPKKLGEGLKKMGAGAKKMVGK